MFTTVETKCENCTYFIPMSDKKEGKAQYGECARFPKRTGTDSSLYCGEFKKK